MVELLFHAPIIDPSDDSGTHSRRSSASSHCTVDSSSHAHLSDLGRPLDTIGEDNEGYDDFLVERGISRDMIDSRDARFSPAVVSHSSVCDFRVVISNLNLLELGLLCTSLP